MKRLRFSGIPIAQEEKLYEIAPLVSQQSGNYYFLSNDLFTFRYAKKQLEDAVVIGVANPHFFHVISLVARKATCRRIIAVDLNADQLKHFKVLYDLFLASTNRIDFLQRLFKVTFNAKAIDLLKNFQPCRENMVRGGVGNDPHLPFEKELWNNLEFDQNLFYSTFGLTAVAEDCGLKINANTVGDINTYYATIVCGSRNDYEFWPFTVGYGSGFLRDEKTFIELKEVLCGADIYMLHADLPSIYQDLLLSNRYQPQLIWISNLLCNYFVDKYPSLKDLISISTRYGTQSEPHFPEIDLMLLQDERDAAEVLPAIDNRKEHKRKWSVHTRNFSKVCSYLQGNRNLEVVAVSRWIEQDNDISKLPNTDYMLVDEFLGCCDQTFYDTIFLHILVGHGVPFDVFKRILLRARRFSKNLIVLEHNRDSRDFKKEQIGVSVDDMRDTMGAESFLDYGPGKRSKNRNLIFVYR